MLNVGFTVFLEEMYFGVYIVSTDIMESYKFPDRCSVFEVGNLKAMDFIRLSTECCVQDSIYMSVITIRQLGNLLVILN